MAEVSNIFPKNAPEQLNEMTKGLNSTNDATNQLLETTKKLAELLKQNNITYSKLTEAQKKAEGVSKQLTTVEDRIVKNAIKINELNTNRAKTEAAQKVAIQAKNKELKDSARLEAANSKAQKENIVIAKAQKGAYDAITAALTKNVAKWKSLTQTERDNTKAGQKLTATIRQQDAALKNLDKQIGRSQRSVGSYKDALKGIATQLFAGLGVVAGIRAFIRVLGNSIKTIAQFDQAQATTAATLGKTKEEIKELTESAIELGRVTQFTATQVSILQNELAKLGFTVNEIKAATPGILDFAAATGAELGEAASVAGGALKAFNLEATQIDRVVSVMAISTTKSALQFSDFSTILGTAAPIANKYSLEIEDMFAVMGKLRDAQFDASSASTAFRNILLKLSDPASELSKRFGSAATTSDELFRRLKILKDEGANLAEILKITDVRAAGAFSTMIDNVEGINTLKDSITGVNDELADMVETKTDNVIGATARLGSAWEGLVLKFRNSAGVFSRVLDDLATSINVVGNENISIWKKNVEVATFGLVALASNQQKQQDEFTKRLRTASIKDIEFTLEKNKDKFDSDNKYWNNLKALALERIETIRATEIDSEARIAKEKEDKRDADLKGKEAFEAKIAEMNKSAADKEIEEVNEKYSRLITEAQSFGVDITELEQMQADEIKQIRIDSEEKANKEIESKRKRHFNELRRENEKFVEDVRKTQRKGVFDAVQENKKAAEKVAETDLEKLDLLQQQAIDANALIVKDEEEKEATKQAIISASFQAAGAIGDAITNRRVSNLQKEFDVLMLQKEAELAVENLTAEEKEKIEAKFAKKAAEIKTKQAKAEKRGAIFSILINTAAAVVKALPNLVLAGIAGALGAVQLGIAIAHPIPQFAEGTHGKANTPSEFIAGEKKRELMTLKSGQTMLVNEPTHFKGNDFKGATIKSNPETEKILSQSFNSGNVYFDTLQLQDEIKALHRTIRNKPVAIFQDGKIIGSQTGGHREIYLNRLRYGE